MANFELMRSQKYEVFKVLSKSGLDHHLPEFKWDELKNENNDTVSKLSIKLDGRELYFIFGFNKNARYCVTEYFPGETVNVFIEDLREDWKSQLQHLKEWADRIEKEFASPDVWNSISDIGTSFFIKEPIRSKSNPISAYEASEIKKGLSKIPIILKAEYNLDTQNINMIEKKLDYLDNALDRQSRIDWIHTAIGVFVSIAMTIGVSTSNGGTFWNIIKDALGVPFHLMLAP